MRSPDTMWPVALLGWALCFALFTPLGLAVFRALSGRVRPEDYLFGKVLGFALFAGFVWVLAYIGLPALNRGALGFAILVTVSVGVTALRRQKIALDLRAWLMAEWLFLLLVLGFVCVRGFHPTLFDGEKPMEMMMLSSCMRAENVPPEDAWMAGERLHYYYYGFFAYGLLGKLVGTSSFVAFNLSLASIWSLSIVGLLYLGKRLTGAWRFAVLFPVLYALVGNLASFVQLFQRRSGAFDWWAPSRAVPGVITEFPAFSYLYGDFHPHMIASVWLVLLVVLVHHMWDGESSALGWGLLGLTVGTTVVTNSWSVVAVGLLAAVFVGPLRPKARHMLIAGLSCAAIVVPYLSHTGSVVRGLAFVSERSPFSLWIVHWLILLSGAYWSLAIKPRDGFIFRLVLAAGVLLILPEIVYIRDIYENRSNTGFKLWWDGWLLLSIVAATGLVKLTQLHPFGKLWTAAHVCAGGLYLPLALPVRYGGFTEWYGGDPAVYVFSRRPDLREPYERLWGSSVKAIYEPPGNAYSDDSLLSAFTGVPTLLGWAQHEVVWRGNWDKVNERRAIAKRIKGCDIPPDVQGTYGFSFCFHGRTLVPVPGKVMKDHDSGR